MYKGKKISSLNEYFNILKDETPDSKIKENKDIEFLNQLILARTLGSVFTPFNETKIYTDKNEISDEIRKELQNDLSTMKLYNHLKPDDFFKLNFFKPSDIHIFFRS
jgi:hypothetical protein